MKKAFLILLPVVIVIVVIFFLSRQDERQIRRNIASLSASISALMEKKGPGALMEARKIGLFFSEDCRVIVGEPLPEIRGREALISAAYRITREVVADEVEITLYDISITIEEDRLTALSLKTVVATGIHGREIRNVEMRWRKIDGRWKIETAVALHPLSG